MLLGVFLVSCLCDKVHTFYPVLLEFAQIVCIIIDPSDNAENQSDSFGKRDIWNFEISYWKYMLTT